MSRLAPRARLLPAALALLALSTGPAAAQRLSLDPAASAVVGGVGSGALAWADYDGDGDPDLASTGGVDVVSNSNPDIVLYCICNGVLYRNDGGTLVFDAAASAVIANVYHSALAWADYDGDGDLDLALTGINKPVFGTEPVSIVGELYRNDGGVLVLDAAASAVVADTQKGALAWADYDGDGDPDLALTGNEGTGRGRAGDLYRNSGGALVLDAVASAVVVDVLNGTLAWADYDGDGDPDLTSIGSGDLGSRVGEIYQNQGGVLVLDAAASTVVADVTSGALAWADYDGDGDPDLALTGQSGASSRVGVLYRNSGGTLALDATSSAVIADVEDSALAWADYDSDGDPDLAATGSPFVGDVYRNARNLPPTPDVVVDFTVVVVGTLVALNGTASSDPDGDALSFAGTLAGPGGPTLINALTATPSFCAAAAGEYTATLVVSDGEAAAAAAATVTAITPSAALDALAADIRLLGAPAGPLSGGQANALTQKLRQAQWFIGRGEPSRAVHHLAVFAGQVASFQANGSLSAAEAAALTAPGAAVSGALRSPCTQAGRPAALVASEEGVLELRAPYPNPARGTVTVSFEVAEAGPVRLSVYDVLGRAVVVLVDGQMEAGPHAAMLATSALPAGTYVVRLTAAGGASQTQRLTVLE